MSWKEPGNGGNQDPWRGGNKQNGPPDLDELLRKLKRKIFNEAGGVSLKTPGGVGYFGFFLVGIAVLVLWALSGIFIVAPPEQAVILRFGKYVDTVGPGPHWIPRFIESRYIVNVSEVDSYMYNAEMLTVDENIVSVQLSVQYRRIDPKKYMFNVLSPVESLKQATASALRQVVGNTTLNSILTVGREKARTEINEQLIETLALYQTGIEVVDVNLQPAKPPEQVTAAFDDAIKAREDEQRYLNQAVAYSNKEKAIVQGKVKRMLQEAEAERQKLVANAKADVAGFLALLPEYKRSPVVTRERMYLDTVESIMSHSSKVLMDVKSGNNLVYIPLDKMMKQGQNSAKSNETDLNIAAPVTSSETQDMTRSINRAGYTDIQSHSEEN